MGGPEWDERDPREQARRVARRAGNVVQLDASIRRLSFYRVGGNAAALANCRTLDELRGVATATAEVGIPVFVAGRGSNLLISDDGFPGLVVTLGGDFEVINVSQATLSATAGGGARLQRLADKCGSEGLHGLEWAVGVPASVGGAVCTNAGCHGSSMHDSVDRVRVIDITSGDERLMTGEDCAFEFRGSAISPGTVVIEAQFNLEASTVEACAKLQQEYHDYRSVTHPRGRNTGSVFKNDGAWSLIKDAGATDFSVGCARVTSMHANFIEVTSRKPQRSHDVFELMCRVKDRVRDHCGVELQVETSLLGFSSEDLARLGAKQVAAGFP